MTTRFVLVTALVPILLGACRPTTSQGAAGEERDEHPSAAVTVWDQGHELFVEYSAPVAGEAFTLVTHVTVTASGAPRTAGELVFALRSPSGVALRHVEAEPARAGVYLPELTLPTPGEWTVTVEIPLDDKVAAVVLPPISVHATHDAALAADLPEGPDGIAFLKEQAWRLGTRIAPLTRRVSAPRISVTAVVRAVPERSAVVTPPVAGRLEAPAGASLPHLGERVAAGDLLGHVRPPFSDFVARVQAAAAEVVRTGLAADRAEVRLERVERLFEIQARSTIERDEARFEASIARAERDAAVLVHGALAAAGLSPSVEGSVRFDLLAPVSGIVREVLAVSGAHVGSEAPLFVIRDSSVVLVEAQVRPEDLEQVTAINRPLLVHRHGALADVEAIEVPNARLVLVGDQIDEHNLTLPVLFELPNEDGHLHIGELIEVELPIGDASPQLLLSTAALVEEDGQPVAYVQLAGETFEKRFLDLGFRAGTHVQVLSGIEEGEWVVVEGAFAVRLASATGSGPSHGHAH